MTANIMIEQGQPRLHVASGTEAGKAVTEWQAKGWFDHG
jgi:hypothetical protein